MQVNEFVQSEARTRGARFLPILRWAPQYNRAYLRPDLIAGVTVTALIVPKNLGYAEIAKVPIENGLYAAAAGAILYGIFGTSRQISTGPSSALAAVAGSAVLEAGISRVGTAEHPVSVVVFDLQGAGKLGEIADSLHAKGLSFRLARVKPRVMDVLERDGLVERIGPANFHLDVNQAVEAHLPQMQPASG